MKKTISRLYYYFKFNCENFSRTLVLFITTFIMPCASAVLPEILLTQSKKKSDSEDNDSTLYIVLGTVASIAVLNGIQQGLIRFLQNSTTQAMRKHHLKILEDNPHCLISQDNSNITSLEYVTVSGGVKDFVTNSISICAGLPMFLGSIISNLCYVRYTTKSPIATLYVASFISSATVVQILWTLLSSKNEVKL